MKTMRTFRIFLFPGKYLVLLFLGLFISCDHYKKNSTHQEISDASIEKGKQLASVYCQTCHLLPDPFLLDTKTWENGVLPEMGPRLGIFTFNYKNYPANRNDVDLPHDFYPSQPVITSQEWQHIIDYYTAISPDSLPSQERKNSIKDGSSLFSVSSPVFKFDNPTTCLIKIDTSVNPHQLWVGDILKKSLFRFDDHLNLIDSLQTTGPIVDLSIQKNKIIACDIGIVNPTNAKFGRAQTIIRDSDNHISAGAVLFQKLQRPVQITVADLDNDGKSDFLVCEFGYMTGALSWYKNLGGNKYERHIIREVPGAIKAYITDYNHDGLPDLWVLFAQGDEGIFLFTNKGNGQFRQEEVLRFPPSYGSTYFELDDFNKDGYPDILYTCGDNGDYSRVLKPYHGVYIFLNDKTYHFNQIYFFPINGCYKAIARDFDGDGDLDIATIAFFADFAHQPDEGFVFLENQGDFNFLPFSIPETKSGRWFTMDAADFDGDGRPDIVLGNCSYGPTIERSSFNWKKGPPFMILKNIGKRHQLTKK